MRAAGAGARGTAHRSRRGGCRGIRPGAARRGGGCARGRRADPRGAGGKTGGREPCGSHPADARRCVRGSYLLARGEGGGADMSLRRITAMMRKEFIQIARDVRSLLIIFAIPLILLFIYGYAVNLDVKHVPLCVYARDGSQDSQDLLKSFQATDYFDIVHLSTDYRDVVKQIDEGTCPGAIVIPYNFSKNLRAGGSTPVQAILDASDSNSASIGLGYAQGIVAAYSSRIQLKWAEDRGIAPPVLPVDIRARTWFNENLQSMADIVPGVVALVMAVVGAFLTSLTIAREWERGTMEQHISTPVSALEIQIGK